MSDAIPIKNLYYLLCYAWDKLDTGKIIRSVTDGERDVTNLLARIVIAGTGYIVRRGLDRAYVSSSDCSASPRGRIDFASSVRRSALAVGRAECQFQELHVDVTHNRIIKATLQKLVRTKGIARQNRLEASMLLRRLHDVSNIELRSATFRQVQLHRNNSFYSMVLDACELLLDNLLPSPQGDRYVMQHFAGAPKDMANLFERFVVNFFRREQTRYAVSGERLAWHEFRADPAATTHLPVMRTDVVLRSRYRTVLIDCKFYEDALRATSSGLVVRPEHLYQITAYARNLRYTLPAQSRLDAMLLYPVVDAWHAVTLAADEYRVKIRFINLNQDWRCIHADLLKMVGIYGASMNGGLATGDPRWSG